MAKYRYHVLATLSGLLLALAYPGWGFNLGWLVWIGFIPLLWSLTHFISRYDRTYKRSEILRSGFSLWFVAGLVYFLIIFRWFWSIYPLDTLGIQSVIISFVAVLLIYLINSAGMAVFWGIFGLVYSLQFTVYRKQKKFPDSGNQNVPKLKTENWTLATVPAIFILLEYLRSWGFGFLWAGSSSLFGPHWTFGNLAYALAGNSLTLKLVSYIGIYGITFVVVLVNLLLLLVLSSKFTKAPFTGSTLVKGAFVGLIVATVAFGPKLIKPPVATQENDKQINFTIIQTAQKTKLAPSPQETLANLEEQLELLNRVAKEHPESQLIVFPEASDLFKNIALFLTPTQVQKYFSDLFKEPKLIIAGGRIIDANGRAYSRVFNLDTKNDIINYYDKRLLTPGGEFLPYPIKLIANLFSKTTISQFDNLRELNVGTKDVSTVNFHDQFRAAPMICSELLSPGLTKQTTQNSDVVVSMASYGVFHGSSVIARQMLAATRFRAAETARPIVTAANLGRSYAVDSQGNIAYLATGSTPQILTGSIVLGSSETWYNRWGDIPILMGSLVLVIVFSLQLTVYSRITTWFGRPKNKENVNNL